MTATVCSGVTAAGVKWRVVGDPICPSAHPAAATSSATKDCQWVFKGHPMVPAGSPQCAAYHKRLEAILFPQSQPTNSGEVINPMVGMIVLLIALVVAALLLPWLLPGSRSGGQRRRSQPNARERAAQAEAEVQRLAERVKQLEGQLQAATRAAASEARKTGPQETGGSFAKLKALVIRELHPDGNPQAGALERTMRAELFKSLWPAIERLEKEG